MVTHIAPIGYRLVSRIGEAIPITPGVISCSAIQTLFFLTLRKDSNTPLKLLPKPIFLNSSKCKLI